MIKLLSNFAFNFNLRRYVKVDGYLVAQDLPEDLSDSGTVSAWISHPG